MSHRLPHLPKGLPLAHQSARSVGSLVTIATLFLTLLVLLGGSIAPPVTAAGKIFYVDPEGSDTHSGSQEQPWQTLSSAAQKVTPGDTIRLNPGTYTEEATVYLPPQVSVEGAGRTATVVRGPAGATLFALLSDTLVDGRATLRDFSIDGQNRALGIGIEIRGRSNITVANVNVADVLHAGVAQSGTDGDKYIEPTAYVQNLVVRDCTFTNVGTDYDTYSTGALMIGALDGGEIFNNTIANPNQNNGYGIKFTGNGGWFKNTKIHHNTIAVNPSDVGNAAHPEWGGDFAIELWSVMGGNEIYSNTLNQGISLVNKKVAPTTSVKVYDNQLIYAGPAGTWGKNMGIELMSNDAQIYNNYIERFQFGIVPGPRDGDSTGADRSTIHHNVFRDSHYAAVEIDTNPNYVFTQLTVANNTFDEVAADGMYVSDLPFVRLRGVGVLERLELKNNLFIDMHPGTPAYKVKNGDTPTLGLANITNNWFASTVIPIGNNLFTGDPQIKAVSRPSHWEVYYAPQNSSGLIDQGIVVDLPYRGTAPDIGAVEKGGKPTVPPTSTPLPTPLPTNTPTPAPSPTPLPTGTGGTVQIEAESYSAMSGVNNYGSQIGGLDDGDWTAYDNIDFAGGAVRVDVRIAAPVDSVTKWIEFRLDAVDGPLLGTLTTQGTGGFDVFATQSTVLSGGAGTHTLYLVYKGGYGVGNLDAITVYRDAPTP